jgi:GNAT superfamily N-acetyltransferase
MSEILEDFSPPAVVAALEANILETFPRLGRTLSGHLQDSPEGVWYSTGVAFGFYNMVVRAHFAPDDVHTKIAAIMGHFQARQAPMLWFLGPTTTPSDLGTHLAAAGLVYEGDDPGMAVDLRTLRPSLAMVSELSIQQVRDATALRRWVETFIVGYEIAGVSVQEMLDLHAALGLGAHPPWRHYLGFHHGEPVATSWMTLGAGVAGIYGVSTRPDARRQGCGAALTVAPLLDARAMGYRMGILQSSAMGHRVYQGLGFQDYCQFRVYSWAGGAR